MKKSKSLFKKSLLIYTLIALLISLIFLIYIFITLKNYESIQSNNFIHRTITSLSDDTLKGYLKEANLDESLLSDYKKLINSDNIKFTKKDDTFTVSLNNRELFTIDTKVVKEGTKLGLFSYQEREVTKITPSLERGLIFYDITIPSNYKLYLDNEEYKGESTKEKYESLDFMYYNDSMPYISTYKIDNLAQEKSIKVTDFMGKEVKLKEENNAYTVEKKYYEFNSYEEAKEYLNGSIDIWDIAHTWNLYLSRDLNGINYGLGTVKEFLIENTPMYQRAYNWAHNIDILFINKHTLKDPIFTNESLKNFKVYGENAFSCEVYLEKNMIVDGKDQVDTMHDNLYFIKHNNEWKLINIKSGGENE